MNVFTNKTKFSNAIQKLSSGSNFTTTNFNFDNNIICKNNNTVAIIPNIKNNTDLYTKSSELLLTNTSLFKNVIYLIIYRIYIYRINVNDDDY